LRFEGEKNNQTRRGKKMKEQRRTGQCNECLKIREMATSTICFTCYRRHRRAMERAADSPYTDLSASPISRDGRRVLAAYPKLLSVLADLRVSRDGVREVIDIVRPYLKPAREWLNGAALIDSCEREQPAEAVCETADWESDDAALGEREQQADVHVHDNQTVETVNA
jgi:hypothetical protein